MTSLDTQLSHYKSKLECLLHYGGGTARCFLCGNTSIDQLTIRLCSSEAQYSTPNNNYSLYRRLRKLGYPQPYSELGLLFKPCCAAPACREAHRLDLIYKHAFTPKGGS
jgi:hypothetical protein